ncbi:MAG TPA: toll/interleukin-1 receptor domain-containing protein [Solirubrobacteraceae bacterium]|nr:toll/interleukin-1 receptor domain-containing protein [Solirubrobacteraceae bacterium]
MADAFVSYSRRDSQFVDRLATSIEERGRSVWLDTEGLADGEVFPAALRSAIDASDSFLFVITPDSVASSFCEQEVEHARARGKRILPLLRLPVPDDELNQAVRDRNWIPFDADERFEASVDRLIKAMDTDLSHVREHTRWLLKALEWDAEERDASFLLHGRELAAAENWLGSTADADPAPTQEHVDYVLASRQASSRRQRRLVAASLIVTAISIGLLVLALISRSQAVHERTAARAQALAAESQVQLAADPPAAVILATRALQTRDTAQTRLALTQALDTSPLLTGLPQQRSAVRPPVCHGPEVTFSPNGQWVVTSVCDGHVVVADARSGRVIRDLAVGRRAGGVAFNRDGSLLAVETDTHVELLDGRTLALRRALRGPGMSESAAGAIPLTSFVAISPDGSFLGGVTGHTVTLWDLRSGAFRTLGRPSPFGFGSLAFTPDSRRLIVGGGFGGSTGASYVYSLPSGTLERRLVTPTSAPGISDIVAAMPDSNHAVVAFVPPSGTVAGVVKLFDLRTGRPGPTIASDPVSEIFSLAVSPDGGRLAVGTFSGGGVWSIASHQRLADYQGNTLPMTGVAFSPDGDRVVSADDNGITRIWRAHGPERAYFENAPAAPVGQWSAALSADRITAAGIVSGRSVLESWSLASAAGAWRLAAPDSAGPLDVGPASGGQGIPVITAFSDDGQRLAVLQVGRRRSALTIWSVTDRRQVASFPAPPSFLVRFTHDRRRLVLLVAVTTTAGQPAAGDLTVLDVGTGAPTHLQSARNPCGNWQDMTSSPDSRLVAASTGCGSVAVWDIRTGRRLALFDTGAFATTVSFASDSRRLLVVGPDTAVWDARSGRRIISLVGHRGLITAGAFSPVGVYVATASRDGTIRVWDARTGLADRTYDVPDTTWYLRFSADGRSLAALDVTGTVRVFETCGGCSDPRALLALAGQRRLGALTPHDRAALAGS